MSDSTFDDEEDQFDSRLDDPEHSEKEELDDKPRWVPEDTDPVCDGENLLWELADIEREITKLRDKGTRLREKFNDGLLRSARGMNERQARDALIELYWMDSKFAGPAKNTFRSLFRRELQVEPKQFEKKCSDCGKIKVCTVASWEATNATYLFCDDCEGVNPQQSEEEEYQAREIAEQAEVQRLRTMPYKEYLKTEHWQELRSVMLKRASYRCQLCNASKVRLDVHHRTYERRGCEWLEDLFVLCQGCHERHHGIEGKNNG